MLGEKQQPADDTVAGAFSKCQQTVACHKKYCLALQRQRAQDPAAFAVEFKGCLNSILTVFKREPAVERLVAFTSKFVAVDENGAVDSAFAVELIEHLLPHAHASVPAAPKLAEPGTVARTSPTAAGVR